MLRGGAVRRRTVGRAVGRRRAPDKVGGEAAVDLAARGGSQVVTG